MNFLFSFEEVFYRPEVMTAIWVCIFLSDWLMNYSGARLYYKYVKNFLSYEEGDNLRPISVEELSHPLRLSGRFASEFLMSTIGIWFLLYTCQLYSSSAFYEIVCGFFILLEACVHFRHIGNVALFTSFRKNSGIKGSISFPHFMMHKTAAVDYAIFAVAFLLLFLINKVNFSLGGSLSCLLVAIYNAILAIVSKVEMMHHSRESAATIPATNNCESVL